MTDTNDKKQPKTWTESRERRELIVSASQISTAQTCVRKWWLERVRKLKLREDPGKFVFGTVFHACAERFLLADDTGRDRKTGKPVDLFPDGWMNEYSRYNPGEVTGTVSPEEAGIIKALVHKGIDTGVLAPYPDRIVEKDIGYTMGKVDTIDGMRPVTVRFMGFIDCASRNTIIDHKTSKSRKYFKSANKLSTDPQMLIYAKMTLDELKSLGLPHNEIVLRHNQFCKDPHDLHVRATEVTVTSRYVEQYWKTQVMPTIEKMVRFRDQANAWSDMPEPTTGANACNQYGGCGYMAICGGRITESVLQKRLDKQTEHATLTISATPNPDPTPERKDSTMNLAQKLAAKKAGAPGGSPSPSKQSPDPDQDSAVEVHVESGMPEGMTAPPWAMPSCSACSGAGFNTKGNPCRVCDVKADDGVKSRHFSIEAVDDGSFVWVHKKDDDNAGVSPGQTYNRDEPASSSRTKEETKDVEVEDAPKAKDASKAKETKKAKEDVPAATAATAATANTGSFSLYINCRPTKTGKGIAKVTDFHDILEEARSELASVSNVESFYDLDAFKRRDAIAAVAPKVAEMVGKGALVACGIGTGASEIRALVDALKPLAKQVVVGDMN